MEQGSENLSVICTWKGDNLTIADFEELAKKMKEKPFIEMSKYANLVLIEPQSSSDYYIIKGCNGTVIKNTPVTIQPSLNYYGRSNNFLEFVLHKHANSDDEVLDWMVFHNEKMNPEREEQLSWLFDTIKNKLGSILYRPVFTLYGSLAGKIRSTASSDMDISISFEEEGEIQYPKHELSSLCHNLHKKTPMTKKDLSQLTEEQRVHLLYVYTRYLFDEKFLEFHYIPKARVPLLSVKMPYKGFEEFVDISIENNSGIAKSELLDLFLIQDKTGNMRKALHFFLFWATRNNLLKDPQGDKKAEKLKFNSYMINHLIIHFVQKAIGREIIHNHFDKSRRCEPYEFPFESFRQCIQKFFLYYSMFDFKTKAIYNSFVMEKDTVKVCHQIEASPLVIVDPLDPTHNIAKVVTEKCLSHFKVLIRQSLYLLKKKDSKLFSVFHAKENFEKSLKNEKMFVGQELANGELVFEFAPDALGTVKDVLVLLTDVLRWDINDYEVETTGQSYADIETERGIPYVIYGKAWLGRRDLRKKLKAEMIGTNIEMSPLDIELKISKQFELNYVNRPEASVRVRLVTVDAEEGQKKFISVNVINGNKADIRDALHFASTWVSNHAQELIEREGLFSIVKCK